MAPDAKAAARAVLRGMQTQRADVGIDFAVRVIGGLRAIVADLNAADLYASPIAKGRDLGMRAVVAIHPAQLPVIRVTLAPCDADMEWTEKARADVVASSAVLALDGAMVDAPVIDRARQINVASRRGQRKSAMTDDEFVAM